MRAVGIAGKSEGHLLEQIIHLGRNLSSVVFTQWVGKAGIRTSNIDIYTEFPGCIRGGRRTRP